ncbi:MAG: hypothetical protein D6724_04100 [Armatimonadetes bacterium]|nr:MAG: hypothetical protein D6724_04100 [Armatimonadota bacterium]
MIAWVAAACLAAAQTPSAEYFPLRPGLKWEYDVVADPGLLAVRQTLVCGEPVTIRGAEAIPMQSILDGKVAQTSYYAKQNGFYTIVALEETTPLGRPIPVLPIEPKRGASWEYDGGVPVLTELTPFRFKARVEGFEELDVLGQKRSCVKVRFDATTGREVAVMQTVSTEWYAPGIGLVKKVQEVKGKNGTKVTMELVSFEGGK